MLMHDKPGKRKTFGMNARPAWYLGPCLKHYRTFRGIVPSTGGERLSDTVRFQHHAIAIPDLTPADRILEAARQLDDAIRQQPKRAPMEELTAIELLREVLLGEQRNKLPANSVQLHKSNQQAMPPQRIMEKPTAASSATTPNSVIPDDKDEDLPALDANYVSDDKEDNFTPINHRARRSKRVSQQQRHSERNKTNRIAFLAAHETASIPDLSVQPKKLT